VRFIGSKNLLLKNIEYIINQNIKNWQSLTTFCDIFSGTTVVARYFKKYFRIISNDLLYFSYVMQRCYIQNNLTPSFDKIKINENIINFLNKDVDIKKNYDKFFIYQNYSPNSFSKRRYLSNNNAITIDVIRKTIEDWKVNKSINDNEYYYLLSSLIESVPFVSNIAGTYGAYLKNWDKRSLKKIQLKVPEILNNKKKNLSFNENANDLVKKIHGDIIYLDPPYNSRQYLPNYHLLETIAKYDSPVLKGKTGIREYSKEKSLYCQKSSAEDILYDLIKKSNFSYVILSYSTDGIIKESSLDKMLKSFSKNNYRKYRFAYRRYKKDKDKIDYNKKDLYELMFLIDKK
jgi:adenine-specific DNA-methyltransferase